ncbi:MAG: hypothetical protein NVSMB66_7530 [Candidatus Doudnabacteria bacterium]
MAKKKLLRSKNSGVYKLYHRLFPNEIYIGSTFVSFNTRLSQHKYRLKNGTHHSIRLSEICNQHGIDLIIECVELCPFDKCRERETFYINTLSPILNTTYEDRGAQLFKTVYQFTRNGILIKKYECIKLAAKMMGIDRATISNCALGKRSSGGGYVWSFTNNSKPLYPGRLIIRTEMDGSNPKEYSSLAAIAVDMNLPSTTAIRNCFIEKQHQAYGYLWKELRSAKPKMAMELGLSKKAIN